MRSLQFYFRSNDKEYVVYVFPTGQRKWEVRLFVPERQRFEKKRTLK